MRRTPENRPYAAPGALTIAVPYANIIRKRVQLRDFLTFSIFFFFSSSAVVYRLDILYVLSRLVRISDTASGVWLPGARTPPQFPTIVYAVASKFIESVFIDCIGYVFGMLSNEGVNNQ
jgi:hypothetical protein